MNLFGIPEKRNWRGTDDHYPTPVGVTWALCNLLILPDRVWEPACGDGAMAEVLRSAGHEVVATTLKDRSYGTPNRDFLKEPALLAPAIVTNPPFKLANAFALHALSLRPEMLCLFLPLTFLEGAARYKSVFARHPPKAVRVFKERVKFYAGDIPKEEQPGWNTEAFAWFIWTERDIGPQIDWVSRDATGGLFS